MTTNIGPTTLPPSHEIMHNLPEIKRVIFKQIGKAERYVERILGQTWSAVLLQVNQPLDCLSDPCVILKIGLEEEADRGKHYLDREYQITQEAGLLSLSAGDAGSIVPRVIDHGFAAFPAQSGQEKDVTWMQYRYTPGQQSLSRRLQESVRGSPKPQKQLIKELKQLLPTILEALRKGRAGYKILHGDLQLDNIVFTPSGSLNLINWSQGHLYNTVSDVRVTKSDPDRDRNYIRIQDKFLPYYDGAHLLYQLRQYGLLHDIQELLSTSFLERFLPKEEYQDYLSFFLPGWSAHYGLDKGGKTEPDPLLPREMVTAPHQFSRPGISQKDFNSPLGLEEVESNSIISSLIANAPVRVSKCQDAGNCKGQTKEGKACKRSANDGSSRCYQHRPVVRPDSLSQATREPKSLWKLKVEVGTLLKAVSAGPPMRRFHLGYLPLASVSPELQAQSGLVRFDNQSVVRLLRFLLETGQLIDQEGQDLHPIDWLTKENWTDSEASIPFLESLLEAYEESNSSKRGDLLKKPLALAKFFSNQERGQEIGPETVISSVDSEEVNYIDLDKLQKIKTDEQAWEKYMEDMKKEYLSYIE